MLAHSFFSGHRRFCIADVRKDSYAGGEIRSVFAVVSFTPGWRRAIREQTAGAAVDDNRFGDQASNVGNDLKGGMATAADTVSNLAGKARTVAAETGNTIHDTAIEAGKRVGAAATETYRQGARAGEYVSRNTAEQPFLALLIAGMIGYGIAYLVHAR